MERIGIILVAGGSGQRCGGALPKQFRLLGGLPVLARTINLFAAALPGAPIVVVLPSQYTAFWKNLAARFDVAVHTVTEGGATRFHSVQSGLKALADEVELIAVHDAVRPLASAEMIRRTTEAASVHGAAIPVVEPVDSFRLMDCPDCPADRADTPGGAGASSHPIDRCRLRIVQTPQVFRAGILRNAYQADCDDAFTDDASVVERTGAAIFLAGGERTNFKLTTEEDFTLAEAILSARRQAEEAHADDL